MTPSERVHTALAGEHVDRVPFCFWHHFKPEMSGQRMAQLTLEFFVQKFHLDIIKIMPDLPYPAPESQLIQADQVRFLPRLDLNTPMFNEQLICIRTLRSHVGNDYPIILTLFSPLTQVIRFMGKQLAIEEARRNTSRRKRVRTPSGTGASAPRHGRTSSASFPHERAVPARAQQLQAPVRIRGRLGAHHPGRAPPGTPHHRESLVSRRPHLAPAPRQHVALLPRHARQTALRGPEENPQRACRRPRRNHRPPAASCPAPRAAAPAGQGLQAERDTRGRHNPGPQNASDSRLTHRSRNQISGPATRAR